MSIYKHTQRGDLIIAVMSAMSVAFTILGCAVTRSYFIVVPVLLLCGWLFRSLTIEVMEGELRWHFGPGLIRKRVAPDMILSTQPVRTNFLEGWGIHLSRFGWLYNVSGFDAVAIKMKNGQHFALGTNEPEALCRALEFALAGPQASEPHGAFLTGVGGFERGICGCQPPAQLGKVSAHFLKRNQT